MHRLIPPHIFPPLFTNTFVSSFPPKSARRINGINYHRYSERISGANGSFSSFSFHFISFSVSFLLVFKLGRLSLLFRRRTSLSLHIFSPQRRFTGYQELGARGNTGIHDIPRFFYTLSLHLKDWLKVGGICQGKQILRKGRQMDMTLI